MDAPSSPAVAYERLRRAFIALVRTLDTSVLGCVVPATPVWTVHDVLAHVVAITADLNASNFGDGDADAWTARQVEERRGRAVDELVEEWSAEAPTFEAGLALFGDEIGKHYVGDLAQHLVDVMAAVGAAPSIDAEALMFGLDFYLGELHARLTGSGIGLELWVDEQRIALGAAVPAASVHLSAFEAFRARWTPEPRPAPVHALGR